MVVTAARTMTVVLNLVAYVRLHPVIPEFMVILLGGDDPEMRLVPRMMIG